MAAVGKSKAGIETESDNEFDEERMKITFISDEKVPQIILRKIRPGHDVGNSIPENDSDSDDEPKNHQVNQEDDLVVKTRVLTSGSTSGQAIFGFKTPKRKEALVNAAQNSVHSGRKSAAKSRLKKNETAGSSRKPLKQINKKIPLYVQEADDSDVDEESATSSSDAESENDEESQTSENNKKSKEMATTDILDQYFEIHSNKNKIATSDKTLSKLTNPRLHQQDLVKHLKEVQSTHINETAKLIRSHSCQFQNWMFQMLNGTNVLLYGLGSKHNLLEEFRKRHLKDQIHIVINGFFPSITIKQILNMVCDDVLNTDATFRNVIDQASYIKDIYQSEKFGKLFLVVHNIDGQMLRSKNVQSVMACLASSNNIHIIASIDHINAPLIWDQNLSSSYNWLWYDCTTYEPYVEETSYENSLMVQQSGSLALSSLIHVLRSLTPNAKGIFKLLVDLQLDNEDNPSYQGLAFGDLYVKCRERFLVNSDLTLRAQLTEFKDHKLIKTKKGYNGLEYLSIALECGTLRQYLEHENNT